MELQWPASTLNHVDQLACPSRLCTFYATPANDKPAVFIGELFGPLGPSVLRAK